MSPSGIDVRPGRFGEEAELLRMLEWLFEAPGTRPPGFSEDHALAAIAEAISAREAEILVATEVGRPVGLCSVYLDINSIRFGRRAWVEDMVVDPERRSQGIGRALLEAARRWALAHHASHLELDSAVARADAHRFYEGQEPAWTSRQFAWKLGP